MFVSFQENATHIAADSDNNRDDIKLNGTRYFKATQSDTKEYGIGFKSPVKQIVEHVDGIFSTYCRFLKLQPSSFTSERKVVRTTMF